MVNPGASSQHLVALPPRFRLGGATTARGAPGDAGGGGKQELQVRMLKGSG